MFANLKNRFLKRFPTYKCEKKFLRKYKIKIKYNNFNILLIIYLLIIYLFIHLSKQEILRTLDYISEIIITIKGNGNQSILSDLSACGSKKSNIDYEPDQILVNGDLQDYKGKIVYNLNNNLNDIIIRWNSQFNSSSCMFSELSNITKVDLSNFDASEITDMRYMFYSCSSLTSIIFNNLNTSKVTIVRSMFDSCISLTSLDLKEFDTSSITVMIDMFNNCSSIKYLDLKNFDTSEVTAMNGMFKYCRSLKSLNLNNFDTSKVSNMKNLFYECNSLITLNINNFDTSKVTNMDNMFYGCNSLISLDLNNFYISNITSYENMLLGCKNLIYCINETRSSEIISLLSEYKNNCPFFCYQKNKKIINDSLICIDNCNNSILYNFEYNEKCYNKCPEGSHISSDNDFLCEKECPVDLPYENTQNNECIEKCGVIDILNNICKIKNSNNLKIKDNIILSIREELRNGDLYPLLSNVIDKNEDLYIYVNDIIYQITSTYNQNNNQYNNITILKLGECEKKLKSYYNISENESLILFKIEIHENGLLIPVVEYEVYNSNGKINMDLNICNDTSINLFIPVTIDENNLFKYNKSSEYYNDICFPFTTEIGTDIILKDRKEEFINKNLSLCEPNCQYEEYDLDIKRVKCECKVKTKMSLISNSKFNKDILINNFINVGKTFNIKIIKCYKILFSVEGLKNNIGSYILLLILLLNIIFCFIFKIKGYKQLLNEINKIIRFKLNNKDIIYETNFQKGIKLDERDSKENKNKNKIYNIYKRKQSKRKKSKKKTIKEKKNKKIKVGNINNPSKKIKKNNLKINSEIIRVNGGDGIRSSIYLRNSSKMNSIKKEKSDLSLFDVINIENNRKNIINKIVNYNDYELNNLKYEEALEIDKRTYIDYYFSLLKRKQLIIFNFYNKNDYNSKIIKIILFLFSFALYFIVNALFFDDSVLHKIYENQGKYDLIYQIPQILYSAIISTFINTVIKSLSLSEKNILSIKKENGNIKFEILKVLKCLKIKFIFFFILDFIFLLLFWYYISCFCAIYKNTQIHLLKDTIISYFLSLLYPFGINLIPGLFRIPSLKAIKRNRACLYKFSQIVEII